MTEFNLRGVDPCHWQPYKPGDETYQPLAHRFKVELPVPADLSPGQYRIALWMPDHSESIRMDPRYAVRVANRDVPWWTNAAGQYGANVLGSVRILP